MKRVWVILAVAACGIGATEVRARDLPVATRGGQAVSSLDVGLLTPSDQGPVVQNWDSFDIGRGRTFDVLNNTGVLINNVVGRRGISQLQGTLNSWTGDADSTVGGDVVILNPQGIRVNNGFQFNGSQLVLTSENTLAETLDWDYQNLTVAGGTPENFLGVAILTPEPFSVTGGAMFLNAAGNITGNASFDVAEGGGFAANGANVATFGAVEIGNVVDFSVSAGQTVAFTGNITNNGSFSVGAGNTATFRGVDNADIFIANAGTSLVFGNVTNQENADFDAIAGKVISFGNVVNQANASFDAVSQGSEVFRNVTNEGTLTATAITALSFGNAINLSGGEWNADSHGAAVFRAVTNDGTFTSTAGTTLSFGNVTNESNGTFAATAGTGASRLGNLVFANVTNQGDFTGVATNLLRANRFVQNSEGLTGSGDYTLQSTAGMVSVSQVQVAESDTFSVFASTNATIGKLQNAGTTTVDAGKTLTVSSITGETGLTTLSGNRVVVGRANGQAELNLASNHITTGRLNNLTALAITDGDMDDPAAPSRFTVTRGLGVDDITIGTTAYTVREQFVNRAALVLTQNNFERYLDDGT